MWKKLLELRRFALNSVTQGNGKAGRVNTSMIQEGFQTPKSHCAVQNQEEKKGPVGVSQSTVDREGIKTK